MKSIKRRRKKTNPKIGLSAEANMADAAEIEPATDVEHSFVATIS